jgi:hypothetical protein
VVAHLLLMQAQVQVLLAGILQGVKPILWVLPEANTNTEIGTVK